MQHVIVPKPYPADVLLRVAAVQLPRLSAEDRAALLPYVKRDLGDHPASPDHHSLGHVSQVNHD